MSINMSIRHKAILLISVSLTLFIGLLTAVSYHFVTHRFEKLEQDEIEHQLATVHNEFQSLVDTLESTSVDWGGWDDTYEFVADGNSEYVDENLNDDTIKNLRLNFMLFYDISGNLTHQKFVTVHPDAPEINKRSLLDSIQSVPSILSTQESGANTSGLLIAEPSAYLIASHYITNSLSNAPIRGTLVIGIRLDSYEIEQIGNATQTRLTVSPSNNTGTTGTFIDRLDSDTILGRSQLVDLTGKQELIINVESDRGVFRQGLVTWRQNALSMVVLGGVFTVLFLLILDRSVFNQLNLLAEKVGKLSFTGKTLNCLEVKNDDEVGKLAGSINEMLTALNKHHVALVESEMRYRMLIEFSPLGIGISNARGVIVKANQAFASMLGYEIEELLVLNFLDITHPDDFQREKELIQSLLKNEATSISLEKRYRHKNGHYFWAHYTASKLELTDDEIIVFGFSQDITPQKQMAQEREKIIAELQESLMEIKELRGILPICSNCKKIRDDKGYWNQIESYIRTQTYAEFSHGICPDCAKKLYGDLYEEVVGSSDENKTSHYKS